MDPLTVSKENIWNYKQNKPSYIARDLKEFFGVPIKATLKVLMSRGVFKWFAVRRELISFKEELYKEIVALHDEIKELKQADNNLARLGYARGRLHELQRSRNHIRKMCKSERWRAVDFDEKSFKELNG